MVMADFGRIENPIQLFDTLNSPLCEEKLKILFYRTPSIHFSFTIYFMYILFRYGQTFSETKC